MSRRTQVLIVDDREVVRTTLQDILLDFDCAFSEAGDGGTALRLMSETQFDVIFLDLKLPDRSGVEVLREGRRLGTALGKVIILTGQPEPTTQAETTELGAFSYLKKSPLDWQEIRNTFVKAVPDAPPRSSTTSAAAPERKLGRKQANRLRRSSPKEADPGGARRPRLLVLDDNKLWLETMGQVLGADFDLVLTNSVEEALRRVKKEHFALVVLDKKLLGGVSGLDVFSEMRKVVPDLWAIILTQYPDYGSAVESGRRGALDYVPKDLATLPETIKRILNKQVKPLRVFLSYETTDRLRVAHLYKKLMARGLRPWMDCKDIKPGIEWEPEIRRAIEEVDRFVYCLSRYSLYKEGTMRKELRQALERQAGLLGSSIFFITARLEDCEVLEPIRRFQYVDLFRKDGFAKLVGALSSDGKSGV